MMLLLALAVVILGAESILLDVPITVNIYVSPKGSDGNSGWVNNLFLFIFGKNGIDWTKQPYHIYESGMNVFAFLTTSEVANLYWPGLITC